MSVVWHYTVASTIDLSFTKNKQ